MWEDGPTCDPAAPPGQDGCGERHKENPMSKRGRKRRARKGNGANHGKRPNA
jgi:hypothetical protein